MFGDIHIEGRHKLAAVPARSLLHGVDAVGQLLSFGKAVFIADKIIPFAVIGGIIAACGFKIDRKARAFLRRFDLRFAVIAMLDDGDPSLDDSLGHIHGNRVILNGEVFRFRADRVDRFIQQIPLGGADLADRPVIAAYIVIGGKAAVCIGGVGVDQLIATVNPIYRTCKRSIALRRSRFAVALVHRRIPLFQDIDECLLRNGIPFNSGRLVCGDDIAVGRVHLLKHIAGAGQYARKVRLSRAVRHGIFIDGDAGEGSAVKVEAHTLNKIVLRGLDNREIAALEYIVEGNGCRLSAHDRNGLGVLRLILIRSLLGNGVCAGNKVVDQDRPVASCHYGLLNALAADCEANAGNHAVLRGLYKLNSAGTGFHIEIAVNGIGVLHAGHNILQGVRAVCDQLRT